MDLTTLQNGLIDPPNRRSIIYYPKVTNALKPIYRKHGIELVHSNSNTLKQHLGTLKDKLPDNSKSGIYKIVCQQCNKEYFGLSCRCIEVRYVEHDRHWRFGRGHKSSVALHMLSNKGHTTDISNLSLVKEVTNEHKLRFFEATYIHKNKSNLMNGDLGNVISPLLNFFTEVPKERTIFDIDVSIFSV